MWKWFCYFGFAALLGISYSTSEEYSVEGALLLVGAVVLLAAFTVSDHVDQAANKIQKMLDGQDS